MKCKYTMDPSGDVVLTLQCPDEPFAAFRSVSSHFGQTTTVSSADPSADGSADVSKMKLEQTSTGGRATPATSTESSKTKETEVPTKPVTFRVSSRHLILASPVFKALLTGGWREGQPAINGEYQITAEGWEADAMVVFLDALHGRYLEIPKTVTLELLAKIAVIVDYYAAHEAMHLLYPLWVGHLRAMAFFATGSHDPRELALWICITWVFSDEPTFVNVVRDAVEHNATEFWAWELPIPGAVIDRINNRRKELVDTIHSSLRSLVEELIQGREGCDAACRTMQLGVLYQTVSRIGLLGYVPGVLPPIKCVSEIVKKIEVIECPEWYGKGDVVPHNCQSAQSESAKSGDPLSPVATTASPTRRLFGSPRPTTAARGLFGNSGNQTTAPATFGSPAPAARTAVPNTAPSFFTAPASAPPTFGNGLFGSSVAQSRGSFTLESSAPGLGSTSSTTRGLFGGSSTTTAVNAAPKTKHGMHAIATRTAALLTE
ncbi:hypothetical protein B0T25DRAFT_603286 [Lasiosphaeria hispida]|uniref:BTB domain-containing protein n=1 Tax=Lasiosphaeria hispida TaxID=260671 RepID=A0AAJ0HLB5_9PEZI|nr:hypothetical protein B0T25DRAFT_603286 [Lasiosphaeria hispida]